MKEANKKAMQEFVLDCYQENVGNFNIECSWLILRTRR